MTSSVSKMVTGSDNLMNKLFKKKDETTKMCNVGKVMVSFLHPLSLVEKAILFFSSYIILRGEILVHFKVSVSVVTYQPPRILSPLSTFVIILL